MTDRSIPHRPDSEQYRKQAKELLHAARAGEPSSLARIRKHHPRLRELTSEEMQQHKLALADAQLVLHVNMALPPGLHFKNKWSTCG